MKVVAMIPARLGSQRVKKKNLRMLGDKPLIAHVLQTALASKIFDDVYINSEADIFGDVAATYGAKFYKRPPHLSTNSATNDQFALDFMENISCDLLVQLNPTSPFLSVEDIQRAVAMFENQNCDTVLAVVKGQIEGVFQNHPINYVATAPMPPSQELTPIYLFCNGILAWRTEVFRRNMKELGCGVYGGKNKTGFCVLEGDATLDIDNDNDFAFAELVWEFRNRRKEKSPQYWDELRKKEHAECVVSDILKKDGVNQNDLDDANHELTDIPNILAQGSRSESWSKRIINSPSNCVTLIAQMPGEGNRLHYHSDWDEWWYILEGQWDWNIEGQTKRVKAGDVVFISRNRLHKITAAGNSRAVRMAVSRDLVAHIYPEDNEPSC